MSAETQALELVERFNYLPKDRAISSAIISINYMIEFSDNLFHIGKHNESLGYQYLVGIKKELEKLNYGK
jgi:hypothetical protein